MIDKPKMPAPISLIIPTLNSAATLGSTLARAFGGVQAGLICEVIFADGGSEDQIASIADETGAQLVVGPAGRGGQLQAGIAAAKGDWFLILHSDTVLDSHWANCVQTHLKTSPHAGYFKLNFDADGLAPRLVAGWANLRSRLFGMPYGDQGLLISKELYAAIGGYKNIPLMEDVAIARALQGHLVALDCRATTSAQKYVAHGWVRRGGRNLATLIKYLMGADPEKLAQTYRKP